MSRSVETPFGAAAIAYRDVSYVEDEFDWDMFKTGILYQLQEAFPSLVEADSWIGRECHVVLENAHCKVTISEYCGLAAIALVPEDHDCDPSLTNLAERWCAQVSTRFISMLSELRHVATASNGEAFFERVNDEANHG